MIAFIKKYFLEKNLFIVLVIINALPVFVSSHFITLDGGAHAYNTNIISELLFNKESIYHDFYEFNPELVPNWFTHLLLVFLKSVMPYFLAEKIIVLLFLLLTPIYFRKTILLINPSNKQITYLILPFLHFLMLYLGFFNFCYGILFSFIGIYYWTKTLNENSVKKWVITMLLMILTYFSHIFPFIVLVMYCFSSLLFNHFVQHITSLRSLFSKTIFFLFKKYLSLVLIISPLVYLMLTYFKKRPSYGNETFLDQKTLLKNLIGIKPLQVYTDKELLFTHIMFVWISIFALVISVIVLREYFKKKIMFKNELLKHNFLFIAIVLGCLLLLIPDDDGFGGFISSRIILFMWFFFIFWLACQKIKQGIQVVLVIGVLLFQIPLLVKKASGVIWINSEYKKLEGIEDIIEPNASVIQIYNNDENWLGHHLSNYLGANKPILVLDNYEATKEYFPIIWKNDFIPNMKLGPINVFETCFYWKSNPYNPYSQQVDYILMIGEKSGDECFDKTKAIIENNAKSIHKKDNVVLYKINK